MIGVQSLGNLLVLAVIVAPAGTARLLTRRMLPMMVLAALVGIACGIGGLYLSYYADTASGASVAAVMVAVYLVARVVAALGYRPSTPSPDGKPYGRTAPT